MAIAYVVYRNGETPNYSVGIHEKWRNSEKTKRELLDDVMLACKQAFDSNIRIKSDSGEK